MPANEPVVCPTCAKPLDPARLLNHEIDERRIAAGVDTEARCPMYTISCAGCLGAILFDELYERITVLHAGTETTRLRERLADARRRGELGAELARILEKPDERDAVLLAAPEIVAEVADELRRPVRLSGKMSGDRQRGDFTEWHPVTRLILVRWDATDTGRVFPAGTRIAVTGVLGGRLAGTTEDGTEVAVVRAFTEPAD